MFVMVLFFSSWTHFLFCSPKVHLCSLLLICPYLFYRKRVDKKKSKKKKGVSRLSIGWCEDGAYYYFIIIFFGWVLCCRLEFAELTEWGRGLSPQHSTFFTFFTFCYFLCAMDTQLSRVTFFWWDRGGGFNPTNQRLFCGRRVIEKGQKGKKKKIGCMCALATFLYSLTNCCCCCYRSLELTPNPTQPFIQSQRRKAFSLLRGLVKLSDQSTFLCPFFIIRPVIIHFVHIIISVINTHPHCLSLFFTHQLNTSSSPPFLSFLFSFLSPLFPHPSLLTYLSLSLFTLSLSLYISPSFLLFLYPICIPRPTNKHNPTLPPPPQQHHLASLYLPHLIFLFIFII